MRNRYPGTCYRCGGRVGTGEGHFERINRTQGEKWEGFQRLGRRWLLQHAECAIKYRGTDVHYVYLPDTGGGVNA